VISDSREDVSQVGLRIDTVHPAGLDDGVHAGRALSAGVRGLSIMLLLLLVSVIG
jgi:hypothetical protein